MKSVYVILMVLFLVHTTGHSQTELQGRIIDTNNLGLSGVHVFINNTQNTTKSDSEGCFKMEIIQGSHEINFSLFGYNTKIIHVTAQNTPVNLGDVVLEMTVHIIDEVVISGTRQLEKITKSPASIDLITAVQLSNNVGSPEELFALQKGIDFTRAGNFWSSINIRGFNSAFNQKMLILDDNRIAHTRMRTPVGPLSAFVKEDVERVEIVLGPSSALYGPNSLNGLFNTISKSPFKYPGTLLVLGAGSNSLYNVRLRHAYAINKKWAYKITGEYISGKETKFTDSVYVATKMPGEFEGKAEVGLDRDVSFIKGLAAVFYKPTSTSEIGLNYAINLSNSVNAARNNLNGWNKSSLQATYKSKHWFAQAYKTWIILDESINTSVRTSNYYSLLENGQTENDAFTNSLNAPRATIIEEDTYRHNAEIQYNNSWGNFNMVAGYQYQKEHAFSNHTYLLDQDGPITIYQNGVYGQLIYDVNQTGIEFIFTARGDHNSLFGFEFLPKTGITYTKNGGTWRLTYSEGYTAPTLANTHMNLGGGINLGNSEGFTLSDGSKIDPIKPEMIKTLEIGYKNIFLKNTFFLDVDAYYNWSTDFLSPRINIAPQGTSGGAVVTHRGGRPITDFTQGLAPGNLDPGAVIFTNINFAEVQTYGFDVGLNYYFSDQYNLTLNYSYLDYTLDKDNLKNDANNDGKVTDADLSMNSPKHKISTAFNVKINKFYGTVFARWVQKYDFFSGRNIAAKTNINNIYNGSPVIEGQRVGTQFNYGQLGGFYLSVNGNYQLTKTINLGAYVNNILGTGNYEFVALAPTETTFGIELKCILF
ncbi:TonB-dependent receptor [Formosa haliotis]|uniref:TonB-dependent receptor n=1 Tax=Formosa haliotis TaxID=1555194 RepID=UPI0009F6E9A1|nr:TonB-dependent receptor plug domain-containing protein [Formosa haliotis]